MERGPRISMTVSRPAVTAPRSVESGLSFRIPAPKAESFRSIKSGQELKLGNFDLKQKPATVEGPVRTPRLFENSVPFVAPTLDFAQVNDPKPAPIKMTYYHAKPTIETPQDVKIPVFANVEIADLVKQQQPETTFGTKRAKPYFAPELTPQEQPIKEKTRYWYKPLPPKEQIQIAPTTSEKQQLVAVRAELHHIATTEPKTQIVTETKGQTSTMHAETTKTNTEPAQQVVTTNKKTGEVAVQQPPRKISQQEEEIFTVAYKKEETERKKRAKFIKDKFAMGARKARVMIAVTWLYAEKVFNTFGMYTGLEKYTVSGKELAGKMNVHSQDMVSGLAKKIGIRDHTLDLVVDRVSEMPETESPADAIDYINQAIDANPAVDFKDEDEAQGEETVKPTDVVRVLAEAFLP